MSRQFVSGIGLSWAAAVGGALAPAALALADITLSSPNGQISTTISVDGSGQLQYNLSRAGQAVLSNSRMGITVDSVDLGGGVGGISGSIGAPVHTSYPIMGNKAVANNDYREATITVNRSGGGDASFQVVVRAYDTGLAYRYVVPGSGNRTIGGEATNFVLPTQTKAWYESYNPAYEGRLASGTMGSLNASMQGPVSFQLPNNGGYVAITEASLSHYHGMSFQTTTGSQALQPIFPATASDIGGGRYSPNPGAAWSVSGGSSSPWRVVMAGSKLNDLVNNDIVTDVNAAPDPARFPQGINTSYIKPGRALWSWWSDGNSPRSFATQKQYVDYAQQMGFEYVLVDEGWTSWNAGAGETLANLVNYAKSGGRNVGIWVWSGASKSPSNNYSGLRSFLDTAKNAGCVGVKLDFIEGLSDTDSQANTDFYVAAMQLAAERSLMVNFHGASKPTGESRTYPNEMTREGVRGMESGNDYPDHHAGLPFLRMLAGPMDFTPTTFQATKLPSDTWGHRYIQYTTFAHQLALPGLYTSPVTHWADNPANYLAQPAAVLDVLKSIATVWDETMVLDISDPGKLAAIARRKGDTWFLFMINGDQQAKTINNIDLSFLDDGQYNAILLRDGATAGSWGISSPVSISGTYDLDVSMLSGGGFVGRFTPVPEPAGVAVLAAGACLLLNRRSRRLR